MAIVSYLRILSNPRFLSTYSVLAANSYSIPNHLSSKDVCRRSYAISIMDFSLTWSNVSLYEDLKIDGQHLTNAMVRGCKLRNTTLENCTVIESTLDNCKISRAVLGSRPKSKLVNAKEGHGKSSYGCIVCDSLIGVSTSAYMVEIYRSTIHETSDEVFGCYFEDCQVRTAYCVYENCQFRHCNLRSIYLDVFSSTHECEMNKCTVLVVTQPGPGPNAVGSAIEAKKKTTSPLVLDKFPLETVLSILEYCIQFPGSQETNGMPTIIAALRGCPTLYHEALKMYYRTHLFTIRYENKALRGSLSNRVFKEIRRLSIW